MHEKRKGYDIPRTYWTYQYWSAAGCLVLSVVDNRTLNCLASSPLVNCCFLLFPITHHGLQREGGGLFVSTILYIKIQEKSRWIANFIQRCEFTQLLLESFPPSVITSSLSLPVWDRDVQSFTSLPHCLSIH